ncbi:hypothetical protein FACS1894151_03490 [Spirochaetia bacterium]|nr:hypothetical protein FACS1894151_03490 [Spirochaetia bacterium]
MEKEAIQAAIKNFTQIDLTENAIHLFKSLGYNTSRSNPLQQKTFDYFKSVFSLPETFNAEKANASEWKYFDILFQLSNTEISNQSELWDNKQVDNKLIESYLFIVIELNKNEYSRSLLARICREVNKIFPMPVLVLFRYGEYITLSVIDRRINKQRSDKDVLEKVTLIKDISIDNPHRAHIEILFDFSFNELSAKYPVTNFIELHDAWQKILDTKELNKRFYRELSHWYFWAMQMVVFPNPHNEDDHNAKSLIRLLTRLLFVWFVKEKGLVPRQLFDEPFVAGLLKTFDPRNEHGIKNQMKGSAANSSFANSSAYYRAVLQNLFFATLNQECRQRAFRKKGQNQNATTLFRYEDYFTDVHKFKTLLDTVPFMNGGLFECLDRPDQIKKGREGGAIINYEDGFSDRADNELCVPDYLFFSKDEHADISAELDDARLRDVKVDGLLTILNKYKFTVAENTPIEEDIALDPELLGRVFENLLASYNPETKTSARKQTGSFYTPREIVDYMTDISIKAYLQQKLIEKAGMNGAEADAALELLIGYYESDHVFNDVQIQILINAIDTCKILDPACGSGAFPMGVLHKLTFILGKLDPHNKLWAQKQREKAEKIDDADIRDKTIADIEAAFARNELDYGRKLYLVENCIFGVDIQSIAIQISKLRFFISLIVDQKTDSSRDNFGVRPLPNLETKFVAANALIGLEKPPEATALFNEHKELDACKAALKNVRHRLFSAKTPPTKNKLRAEDKAIRRQIAQILMDDRWSDASAKQIAAWEIDDQNASSPWFDAEWMFGVDGGFDVVIGNPPYIQLQNNKGALADQYTPHGFASFARTGDIYQLFYEQGIKLLHPKGHLCLITSNKWMRAGYGESTRKFFTKNVSVLQLIDFAGQRVFDSATVDVNIALLQKGKTRQDTSACTIKEDCMGNLTDYVRQSGTQILFPNDGPSWVILSDIEQRIKTKIENIGIPLKNWDIKIYRGVLTGCNEAFIINKEKRDELIKKSANSAELIRPILRGRDIGRYQSNFADLYLINTHNGIPTKKIPPIDVSKYPAIKQHLDLFWDKISKRDDKGITPYNLRSCAYTEDFSKPKIAWSRLMRISKTDTNNFPRFSRLPQEDFVLDSLCFFTGKDMVYFQGILNSELAAYYFFHNIAILDNGGMQMRQQYIELMPIPAVCTEKQQSITHLVTEIIDHYSVEIDKKLNTLIYQTYQIDDSEVIYIKQYIREKIQEISNITSAS